MTDPIKTTQSAVRAATPNAVRSNKEIVGFLLIAVGALLLYCGMKDYQPIELVKAVISGTPLNMVNTLSGKTRAAWVNPQQPNSNPTTPPSSGGGIVNT